MNHDYPDPVETIILGYQVLVDDTLGHLAVQHDGSITWDELQGIKNAVWGPEERAVEIYPAHDMLVNNATMRHLWRLGPDDFCPDLLGRAMGKQTLEARFQKVWEDDRLGAHHK